MFSSHSVEASGSVCVLPEQHHHSSSPRLRQDGHLRRASRQSFYLCAVDATSVRRRRGDAGIPGGQLHQEAFSLVPRAVLRGVGLRPEARAYGVQEARRQMVPG